MSYCFFNILQQSLYPKNYCNRNLIFQGMIPLHWAAVHNQAGNIRMLLQLSPASDFQKDKEGKTPLHWATQVLYCFNFIMKVFYTLMLTLLQVCLKDYVKGGLNLSNLYSLKKAKIVHSLGHERVLFKRKAQHLKQRMQTFFNILSQQPPHPSPQVGLKRNPEIIYYLNLCNSKVLFMSFY